MTITPDQLAELEKKLSSVQNPTYSVAELCSFDELVNQLMPALIAAASELEEIKQASYGLGVDKIAETPLRDVVSALITNLRTDRDKWKERAEDLEFLLRNSITAMREDCPASTRRIIATHASEFLKGASWKRAEPTLSSKCKCPRCGCFTQNPKTRTCVTCTNSAPPGCDFPDPPIEEKSTFILDHPDPA